MNIENCKFSFIIPIYNTEINLLKRCIKSITIQKLKYYEIIIINDGSTQEELKDYCKNLISENSNVKYFYQKNQGAAVARNKGLEIVTGDYIFFVDADDYLCDNALKEMQYIKENFDVMCCDYFTENSVNSEYYSLNKNIDFSGKKEELYSNIMYVPEVLKNFMFGAIWAKCFSAKFLKENSIRFEDKLRKTQDRVFMLEVCNKAKIIKYRPIPIYVYTTNENSITHKCNMKIIDYNIKLNLIVKQFCKENKIDTKCMKFFSYSIFLETLQLTYLHKNYHGNWKETKNKIQKLYDDFDMKNELSIIRFKDFPNFKGKIKLFLVKTGLYWIIKLCIAV